MSVRGIFTGVAIAALTLVSVIAWAQSAQTDPTGKPAGDATTNTMVPYGVNPPIPDSTTSNPTDSVRPATRAEPIPVPQGNFTSDSSTSASGARPPTTTGTESDSR